MKNEGNITEDEEETCHDIDKILKQLYSGGASSDIAKGDKIRIIKGEF